MEDNKNKNDAPTKPSIIHPYRQHKRSKHRVHLENLQGNAGDTNLPGCPVPFVTIDVDNIEVDTTVPSLPPPPPLKTAFGLDPLAEVDQIFVQRRRSEFEFLTEMYINRRYKIMDKMGQDIFFAGEGVDYESRCWRGMQRRYCMYIFSEDQGTLLYTVERLCLNCCSSRPPIQEAVTANIGCVSELNFANSTMQLANGQFIGKLSDTSRACTPNFNISDSNCNNIINIRGNYGSNWCPCLSINSDRLKLFDTENNLMGTIDKHVELPSTNKKSEQNFCVNFPGHLEPVTKALIIGALLDLNITYFERRCSWDGFVCILLGIWVLGLVTVAIFLILWCTSVISL